MDDFLYLDEKKYVLVEFILRNFSLEENKCINRDTITKIINDEFLNFEEQKELRNVFCMSKCSLLEYNHPLFSVSRECIISSIKVNPNSVNCLPSELDISTIKEVIELIKDNYVLSKESPLFLKHNIEIIMLSLKKDINSANYIDYDGLSKEERNTIVDILCKNNFVLSEKSPDYLKCNTKVFERSYKIDENTIDYVDRKIIPPSIIADIIDNEGKTKYISHVHFKDKDVIESIMREAFFFYKGEDYDKYYTRSKELVSKVFSKPLTIQNIKDYARAIELINISKDSTFINPFTTICSTLRESDDFVVAKGLLRSTLTSMEDVMGKEEYISFLNDAEKYFNDYHNGIINNLSDYLTNMSSFCALYFSKQKENRITGTINTYLEHARSCFIPRKDNKSVISYIMGKRYSNTIKKKLDNKDEELLKYIDSLADKYNVDKNFAYEVARTFSYYSKCTNNPPVLWTSYTISKEASKLVNRLNSGYIKYTDKDVEKYLGVIKFDKSSGKYKYTGETFTNEELKELKKYEKELYITSKIKKDLILKAKEYNEDDEIFDYQLRSIPEDTFSFTDEFYEFDDFGDSRSFYDLIANHKSVDNFSARFPFQIETIFDDEKYEAFSNFLCKTGYMWFEGFYSFSNLYKEPYNRLALFSEMYDYLKTINVEDIKVFDYLNSVDLAKCFKKMSFSLIEKPEILRKIIYSNTYTSGMSPEDKISNSGALIAQMARRNEFTVPYVKGETQAYNYETYDTQSPDILVSGIDTNACFKIGGVDNDLMIYCGVNKNGFVIKITDKEGNFVGRAAGFRNGNAIYFNQLRTIKDTENNMSIYNDCEVEEMRQALIKACNDIINISSKTETDDERIKYAFITKSYGFKVCKSNVSDSLERYIGTEPYVHIGDDWENFKVETTGLQDATNTDELPNDYDNYELICIASDNNIEEYNKSNTKIIRFDPVPCYKRPRNKVICEDKISPETMKKINKIRAVKAYFANDDDFESITYDKKSKAFVGDNWYLVINDLFIDAYALKFDKDAKKELKAALSSMHDYVSESEVETIKGGKMNVHIKRQD